MTDDRKHRSVSQYNQYQRCPYAYKLERIDKVWSRPAAWLAQGSAVHEAAESYERAGRDPSMLPEMLEVYSESYDKHITESCEVTPNFDWWFASGPYGGEQDIERRYDIGLEQCAKYVAWYESHPKEAIWIAPDGTPGIELSFDIDLDGVLVRGFIDAVIQIEQGNEPPVILVRDNKTGNHPGDDFQLGVYGVALSESFGIDPPEAGDYWMGKAGKPTDPFPLHEWTRDKVSASFKELDDNIKAERFDPKPEPSKCRFCSVSYSCEFSAA